MKRRTIPLASLDGVLKEAQHLLQVGYDRAGNWSLGQACNHLAAEIEMTIQGPLARVPKVLQRLFVAGYFKLFFLGKIGNSLGLRMPTGIPQKQPVDDEVGLQRLTKALDQLKITEVPHWDRLHLWHCEHHFSFLIPRSDGNEDESHGN